MTDSEQTDAVVDSGEHDDAESGAPKVGAALFGAAALLFGVAVVLAERSHTEGPNVVVMGLVACAGLALGAGAIAGFFALRQGVTGLARGLSIALCVAPAILGIGLTVRVSMQMTAAGEAAAATPLPTRGAKKSATVGPPVRVALNPAADASAPQLTLPPVARVLFDLDKDADDDAFRKGTWFVAESNAQPLLLTAGHLFGPYANLRGRLKTPMSAAERAAVVGTATFSGALGKATNGQPLHVEGRKSSNQKADVAAFAFANADKVFPMEPTLSGPPLAIAKAPSAGSPVWLAVIENEALTLFKGVVAAPSPVMAVYLDKTPAAFDGVSGAPFVDKDGRVVGVFIGKSSTKDGVVAVGTPLAPLSWAR